MSKPYDPSLSPLGKEILEYAKKNPGKTTREIGEAIQKNNHLPAGYEVTSNSISGMVSQMVRVKKLHYKIGPKNALTGRFVFTVHPGRQNHTGQGVHGPGWNKNIKYSKRARGGRHNQVPIQKKKFETIMTTLNETPLKRTYKIKDINKSLVSVSTIVFIETSPYERVGTLLKLTEQQAVELGIELNKALV